jgi:hypothetical protein
MNENRPAGTLVPGRSPIASKSKKGRSTPRKKANKGSSIAECRAVEPARMAAVHPYDLGREAGVKLRLEVPREEICEGIRLAVEGPRGWTASDRAEQAERQPPPPRPRGEPGRKGRARQNRGTAG